MIKGLFEFSDGLLCRKEVLGKHYKTRISDIGVEIVFPGVPTIKFEDTMNYVGTSNPLLPPEQGKYIECGSDAAFWGYPMQYPKMNSFVKHILFLVECEESEIEEVAQKLYLAIGKWEIAFTSFCQLCTKQNLDRDMNSQNEPRNLSLLSSKGYIQNMYPVCLNFEIRINDEFLSQDQMQQAILFASSGKELLLEYQMLLSAYNSRKKCQNRQAIIDACSAVEICLSGRINSFCAERNIDSELFLNKYRSLGDRLKLVVKIDKEFPISDFDNVIVKPRNDIAHNRNVYPSDDVTDRLIAAVELCLKHYHTAYY